jgi:hypothetical protein
MKRASYCGGADFWTYNGTPIAIEDNVPTRNDAVNYTGGVPGFDQNLEAFWTPTGASCYNPQNVRHPDMGFQTRFITGGWCQSSDGSWRQLQPCTATVASEHCFYSPFLGYFCPTYLTDAKGQ